MSSWVVPGYTEMRELSSRSAITRVTLAWHDATGIPVAIRYLDDDPPADGELRRLTRAEATRLSEVDSPHVIRHREYVESAAGRAIVMELVDGVSLRVILDEGGPLEPPAAAVVLRDSLLGLVAAHSREVLHRDQRPEHVLIDTEGRAKLVEFGAAAGTCPDRNATVHTDLAAVLATYRECLADSGAVPLALPPSGTAAEPAVPGRAAARTVLAELTELAGAAYGPDWAARGRESLALRAARLLGVSAPADRPPVRPPDPPWPGRVLVGVAVALVMAAALATLVVR